MFRACWASPTRLPGSSNGVLPPNVTRFLFVWNYRLIVLQGSGDIMPGVTGSSSSLAISKMDCTPRRRSATIAFNKWGRATYNRRAGLTGHLSNGSPGCGEGYSQAILMRAIPLPPDDPSDMHGTEHSRGRALHLLPYIDIFRRAGREGD